MTRLKCVYNSLCCGLGIELKSLNGLIKLLGSGGFNLCGRSAKADVRRVNFKVSEGDDANLLFSLELKCMPF